MGLLDRIRRNREWRIDVAKAAVLREMAAIDEARASSCSTIDRNVMHDQMCDMHALLKDDDALLAHYESKAGAMSESTTGGELSEVER